MLRQRASSRATRISLADNNLGTEVGRRKKVLARKLSQQRQVENEQALLQPSDALLLCNDRLSTSKAAWPLRSLSKSHCSAGSRLKMPLNEKVSN